MEPLSITEFVEAVRRDLRKAIWEARGVRPAFEVEGITLEMSLTAERAGGGAIKLGVLDLKADATKVATHRVTLQLKVDRDGTGAPAYIAEDAGALPVRPIGTDK